jgi:ribosomal protein L30/L7E
MAKEEIGSNDMRVNVHIVTEAIKVMEMLRIRKKNELEFTHSTQRYYGHIKSQEQRWISFLIRGEREEKFYLEGKSANSCLKYSKHSSRGLSGCLNCHRNCFSIILPRSGPRFICNSAINASPS